MVYLNLTEEGAILGHFHRTESEAITAAVASAKLWGFGVRVIGYGSAGDVQSSISINTDGERLLP